MHAYGTEETLRKRVNIKVGMQVKVTRDVTRAIERCCETRLDSGLTFDSGSSEQPFHATLFPSTYTQSSCTAKPRFYLLYLISHLDTFSHSSFFLAYRGPLEKDAQTCCEL